MQTLKVLIADDSVLYRSQIRAALTELPWVEVVGAASHGRLAIERIQQTHVDLLVLDLEMPEMDGLQTLDEMARLGIKTKVVVFSSASKRGAEITFEALRKGASDFVAKPGSDGIVADDSLMPHQRVRQLLEPKLVALFPDLAGGKGSIKSTDEPITTSSLYPSLIWELFQPEIVVIGSSTGGPTVLERVFADLAPPLRVPVLIAQHMPPIFTATLAERISKLSGISAREGRDGEELQAGVIYFAPGNYHMVLSGRKDKPVLRLNQGPLVNSVRPAVDPLFESVANIYKDRSLGIVLTGMGADGKYGAERIKDKGGAVVIQSEASCVVFGMPGAVFEAKAYDRVMSPAEIVQMLKEKIAPASRETELATLKRS